MQPASHSIDISRDADKDAERKTSSGFTLSWHIAGIKLRNEVREELLYQVLDNTEINQPGLYGINYLGGHGSHPTPWLGLYFSLSKVVANSLYLFPRSRLNLATTEEEETGL